MIFDDFRKAVAQLGDPRFLRVAALGVLLCLVLLAAIYGLLFWGIQTFAPEQLTLPWIGTISWVQGFLGWGSALLMLGLSVFLMVPVASAFTGFFLEDVVEAVEDRHYPTAPPVGRLPFLDGLRDSIALMGLLVVANLVALALFFVAGPFVPLVFWAVNGLLLGREYFTLVAMRRLGREAAGALRRKHFAQVWLAGTLMAIPLSVPLLNLLIPVLGVASYTHMFHRLNRTPRP